MVSRLIFLPEGDVSVPGDFSGIPHFFGKALVDQCGRLPIELHVLQHVDCLSVEDILRLRYGGVAVTALDASISGKLNGTNRSAIETLFRTEMPEGVIAWIEAYWRSASQDLSRRWPDGVPRTTTRALAFGPFVPYTGDINRLHVYVDCCQADFFFDPTFGTLRELAIPEQVKAFIAEREGAILRGCEMVYAFSDWAKGQLMATYRIPGDRILPVGAGVNLPADLPQPARRAPKARPQVLFVGKDFERKGGRVVAEVHDRLGSQFEFAIYTALPEGNHDGQVFRPPVPHDEVPAIFADADLFFFPTQKEPFGLVVAEAMHYGLPVVASDIAAIPEIASPELGNILCDPMDTQGFADAICTLLESGGVARAVGARNREHARYFTWHATVNRILEDMLPGSRSAAAAPG